MRQWFGLAGLALALQLPVARATPPGTGTTTGATTGASTGASTGSTTGTATGTTAGTPTGATTGTGTGTTTGTATGAATGATTGSATGTLPTTGIPFDTGPSGPTYSASDLAGEKGGCGDCDQGGIGPGLGGLWLLALALRRRR